MKKNSKKTKKKSSKKKRTAKKTQKAPLQPGIKDTLRQSLHYPEWRIGMPMILPEELTQIAQEHPELVEKTTPPVTVQTTGLSDKCAADIGTCLWYLKTKYFKRNWESDDSSDDDPRVRKALGRLMKGIKALERENIEIQDPTNKRYPPGGERMMKPIQLQPTTGLTFEKVTETVSPIIYRDGHLIQPGEVFVAVPKELEEQAVETQEQQEVLPVEPQNTSSPSEIDENESSVEEDFSTTKPLPEESAQDSSDITTQQEHINQEEDASDQADHNERAL